MHTLFSHALFALSKVVSQQFVVVHFSRAASSAHFLFKEEEMERKLEFKSPTVEIIVFSTKDIICLSDDDNDGIWDMQ